MLDQGRVRTRASRVGVGQGDFLSARSGHDFMQVHIDLLTGRVWLVPTVKTATAETAERNFVPSVFPGCTWACPTHSSRLVSRTATRASRVPSRRLCTRRSERSSSSAPRTTTPLRARSSVSMAKPLMFCAPWPATGATTAVDWPDLVPLVEFTINDSASSLGTGYTPFHADRVQHPCRPLASPERPDGPDAAGPSPVRRRRPLLALQPGAPAMNSTSSVCARTSDARTAWAAMRVRGRR